MSHGGFVAVMIAGKSRSTRACRVAAERR